MFSTGFFSLNGQLYPQDTNVFGTQNRALRYGDGIFETMRMLDGKVMFFKYHMDRLFKGMQALKIDYHRAFDAEFVASEIVALARANKIYKNARIRFSVFREDGGWYTPEKNTFNYLIEIQALNEDTYIVERGLIADVYKEVRKDFSALSHLKTSNSLPYVLAGVYRKENNLDECILLNSQNNIVESISSNVFLIKENKAYTPAITDGCIDGVMRKVVIELLKELNITVVESSLPANLLEHADEIFLTNSIKGIQSVVGIGLKRYYSKMGKQLIGILNSKR
ncbi:MAG: aminotransferase class IV [bacterium]|jgi:branched-subunit amino acid aminotransferase/4-amino-4-deoxychorismate lyase